MKGDWQANSHWAHCNHWLHLGLVIGGVISCQELKGVRTQMHRLFACSLEEPSLHNLPFSYTRVGGILIL